MEIISKAKSAFKFKVVNDFMKSGRRIEPGEELEIKDQSEALGYVQRKLIIPCDLPPVAVYITIRPFSLPGAEKKHEAKAGELVSLKAEDALRLMLEKSVLPKDENRWRPYNMRLAKDPHLSVQQRERLDQKQWDQKNFEIGILQGPEKKKSTSEKVQIKFKEAVNLKVAGKTTHYDTGETATVEPHIANELLKNGVIHLLP